jgi:hypothetical protein
MRTPLIVKIGMTKNPWVLEETVIKALTCITMCPRRATEILGNPWNVPILMAVMFMLYYC